MQLQAASEHIEYQLPNEHSRVGYLLDGIQNNDPGLQAAMANVRSSKGPGEMRGSFEQTVAHILPYDPVAKKRVSGTKRGPGEISDVTGDAKDANVSSFGAKVVEAPKLEYIFATTSMPSSKRSMTLNERSLRNGGRNRMLKPSMVERTTERSL